MSTIREDAIAAVVSTPPETEGAIRPVKEILDNFASDVFSVETMKMLLPRQTFNSLMQTIRNGAPLDSAIADEVAGAMKQWAVEHGATHYTHWFQPLTGATAEKHESFLEPEGSEQIGRAHV